MLPAMKNLSYLNQERNMHRSSTVYKRKQSKTVLNKYVGGFWCERMTADELFHWIMDSYFGHNICDGLKLVKNGLEWCGLLVDYCDVFISCLDSHSDGTHSLQRIHWWASDVMLHFSKSVLMKKDSSTSWMAWGWVNCQQIFFFGYTIPLSVQKHYIQFTYVNYNHNNQL